MGAVAAVISKLGTQTEIIYDALNRKQEIRETDGAVTQYSYDILGNLDKIVDPQKCETLIRHNSLQENVEKSITSETRVRVMNDNYYEQLLFSGFLA